MAYSREKKEKLFTAIFESIENGSSLRKALLDNKLSSSTFFIWLEEDTEKSKQYARATELRAEALLDEMMDIVDDSQHDVIPTELGDGVTVERTNHEVIQRSRLRYDARKWLVSKLNPKKYGDKTILSGDEDNPISIAPIINIIKPE